MSYADERAWSDQFIPEIQEIVGPRLMVVAPFELDAKEATDLLVFKARDMRIAARMRRPKIFQDYRYQFTLRSRAASGGQTELHKVVNGWGDWLFYGFEGRPGEVEAWRIIDLHALRSHLIRDKGRLRSGEGKNGDGTRFRWFDLLSFPPYPPILIDTNDKLPEAAPRPAAAHGQQLDLGLAGASA